MPLKTIPIHLFNQLFIEKLPQKPVTNPSGPLSIGPKDSPDQLPCARGRSFVSDLTSCMMSIYKKPLRGNNGSVTFPNLPIARIEMRWIFRRSLLINVYAQSRSLVDIHISVLDRRTAGKNL